MANPASIPGHLEKTAFGAIPGWGDDDHSAALDSFLRFCADSRFPGPGQAPVSGPDPTMAAGICAAAARSHGPDEARRFFETHFEPFKVSTAGFLTGYFEPELTASRTRTDTHRYPLLRLPAGVEAVTDGNRPQGWPADLSHGRRIKGTLTELPDRGAIMAGALDEEHLELVWLADPIDAFFVHVQGSARLRLADGSAMRVGYAGKTGHPYTGIGRLLVERGEGRPEEFTMAGLRAWLNANPDQRDPLFKQNRSFIFFREITDIHPEQGPVGAAGLPLVAGRSLAVDPEHIPYGLPVFVASDVMDPEHPDKTMARLLIADDTGSAIRGSARGDFFAGSGDAAGRIAGEIRHSAVFYLLLPIGSGMAAGG